MNVGIPGTGLGGLFYAISILFIFLLEVTRFLLGRGNMSRLRFVGTQMMMLVGVVIALVFTDIFLEKVFFTVDNPLVSMIPGGRTAVLAGADAFAFGTVLIATGILATLFVSVHIARFIVYVYDHVFIKKSGDKNAI